MFTQFTSEDISKVKIHDFVILCKTSIIHILMTEMLGKRYKIETELILRGGIYTLVEHESIKIKQMDQKLQL